MSWYADSKKIDTRGEVYSALESRKNVASSIRTNFASHLVKYFANPLRENIASSLMARLKKLGGSCPSTHAIWLPHHTFFIFINTIFSLFAEFQISKSIHRKICCDYTLVLSMFPPLPHNMHPTQVDSKCHSTSFCASSARLVESLTLIIFLYTNDLLL